MPNSNRDMNKHDNRQCISNSNIGSSSSRNTAQAPILPLNTRGSSPLMVSNKMCLMVTPTMLANKATPDVQANPKPRLLLPFRLLQGTPVKLRCR